ncbi:hypothetical protein M0804_008699 [Polistes exclamans]|nr:hypothetical protein M0804_008699 [Polistes exclamans]
MEDTRKARVKPACAGLPPKSPLYCGTVPQAVPIQTNLTQSNVLPLDARIGPKRLIFIRPSSFLQALLE